MSLREKGDFIYQPNNEINRGRKQFVVQVSLQLSTWVSFRLGQYSTNSLFLQMLDLRDARRVGRCRIY